VAKFSVDQRGEVIPRIGYFYNKFIKDFLALAEPFTDLLKKEGSFEWKGK
jgi:hypothetical protein